MTSPQDPGKSWYRLHLWQIQAVRDLLVIAVLAGVVWLGYVVSIVTVPLLVALALAYIVEPLIVWLTTRVPRLGRKRAVLGLLLGGIVAFAVVLLLAVPVVTREVKGLGANAGRYVERARALAADPDLPEWLRGGVSSMLEWLPDAPKAAPGDEGGGAAPARADETGGKKGADAKADPGYQCTISRLPSNRPPTRSPLRSPRRRSPAPEAPPRRSMRPASASWSARSWDGARWPPRRRPPRERAPSTATCCRASPMAAPASSPSSAGSSQARSAWAWRCS